MTILTKIIDHKKTELDSLRATEPNFIATAKRPSLYEHLRQTTTVQVIAEMKRASPSKGDIATHVEPVEQAKTYAAAGAACISVLTESKFFKGSFADLNAVARAVDIPLLCKDFIIDPVQIDYAKAAGASVILLIVAALTDEELASLYAYATSLRLDVLVEVHDVEELARALKINPKIVGVNNRNLKTFEVDLAQTAEVAQHLTNNDIVFISESGIWGPEDVAVVAKAGARAVLVGESLMRSDDVVADLQALQIPLTKVKICGLKTHEHVEAAVQAGADFIGFVFAPSKRRISVEEAVELAKQIPANVKKVGVFVNEAAETIHAIAKAVPLDYIQYHGDETNDFIQQVGLPALKAFSVRDAEDVKKAAAFDVDYYLFDAPGTDFRGGSGHTFDWSLMEEANIPNSKVIVAGGLTVANVAEAVQFVHPAAVDVSSGVERDGIKDSTLIQAFIRNAKGAK